MTAAVETGLVGCVTMLVVVTVTVVVMAMVVEVMVEVRLATLGLVEVLEIAVEVRLDAPALVRVLDKRLHPIGSMRAALFGLLLIVLAPENADKIIHWPF